MHTLLLVFLVLLKDSSAVLDEEQAKKPCRKFMQKGSRISSPQEQPGYVVKAFCFYFRNL